MEEIFMLSNNIMHNLTALIFTVCTTTYFTSISHQNDTSNFCNNDYQHFNNDRCLTTQNNQTEVPQQSWVSWLTGNSRSSQFHYLDLLELIESIGYGDKPHGSTLPK